MDENCHLFLFIERRYISQIARKTANTPSNNLKIEFYVRTTLSF